MKLLSALRIILIPAFCYVQLVSVYAQTYEIISGSSATRNDRLYFGVGNSELNQTVIPTEYNYIYFIVDSQFVQVDYQGKKGVISLEGKVIIPPVYEEIITFDGEVFKVKQNGLWGIVNALNQIQTPIEYAWITDEQEPLKRVKKGNYFGVIDEHNNAILPFTFDAMPIKWRHFYITVNKGSYELYSNQGKKVLESTFSNISPLFNQYLLIESDGKYCIWNPKEPTNLNFEYSYFGKPHNELVAAKNTIGNGVFDSTLNTVVPFKYENPIEVRSMILRVDSSSYFGYYNRDGERLTDIYYFDNRYFSSGWLILESHRKKTLVNISGEKHARFQYPDIYVIDNEKAAVKEEEYLWTIRDIRSNTRISDKTYRYISRFKDGKGFAKNQEGYYLLVNDKLEELSPAKYHYIFLRDGYAEVSIKRKKGILNYKGQEVVPVKYRRISESNGFYSANTRHREDIYNRAGNKVFKKSYKHIINWPNGNFLIYKNRKWGVLDSNSNEILPFKYRQVFIIDDLFIVKLNKESWQILDKDKKSIANIDANYVHSMGDGLIRINKNKKNGLIDLEGNTVIPTTYDRIEFNSKGLVTVSSSGKRGIFSKKGELILPVEFDIIELYYGNFARVRKDGKWGHINASGALLYQPKYDEVSNFNYQKAWVTLNNKQTLIDENGKELLPFTYSKIYYTRNRERLIDIYLNNKAGLLDINLNEVVAPKYTSIGAFNNNNLALVMLQTNSGKKFGVINVLGKELVPPIYNEIHFDNLKIVGIEGDIKTQYTLKGECLNCEEKP